MTIAELLQSVAAKVAALATNIKAAYTKVSDKGGTLPTDQTAANLADAIDSIPSGSTFTLPSGTRFALSAWTSIPDSIEKLLLDCTDFSSMFYGCTITTYKFNSNYKETSKQIDFSRAFYTCTLLTSVEFGGTCYKQFDNAFAGCGKLSTAKLGNCYRSLNTMFGNCSSLVTVDIGDCSNVYYMTNTFSNCKKLENLTIKVLPNISLTGTQLTGCTALSEESLVNVVNALPTTTSGYTLTLGSTNLAKLTDEEKQIATDKGWTLA